MWDARLDVFPLGSKRAVPGLGGGIVAVPCEMCFGAGNRWQNLEETKETLEIPQFHTLSFTFGVTRSFVWWF